jgi:hypothetical protein
VVVTGPTQTNYGATWTATVYLNGVPITLQANQIDWFVNGHAAGGWWGPTGFAGEGPGTLTVDANGLHSLPFVYPGDNTINAEFLGGPSLPNASAIYYIPA